MDLIGRLWHEWAAFSQPLIFFKVSSVPRLSCHICHLPPPTGEALFRHIWELFECCWERAPACTVAVFVILIRAINCSLSLLFPPQNWMATDARCGCCINICIYIHFKHLARIPQQQHGAGEEGGLNRTQWLVLSVMEMFLNPAAFIWQRTIIHLVFSCLSLSEKTLQIQFAFNISDKLTHRLSRNTRLLSFVLYVRLLLCKENHFAVLSVFCIYAAFLFFKEIKYLLTFCFLLILLLRIGFHS